MVDASLNKAIDPSLIRHYSRFAGHGAGTSFQQTVKLDTAWRYKISLVNWDAPAVRP